MRLRGNVALVTAGTAIPRPLEARITVRRIYGRFILVSSGTTLDNAWTAPNRLGRTMGSLALVVNLDLAAPDK